MKCIWNNELLKNIMFVPWSCLCILQCKNKNFTKSIFFSSNWMTSGANQSSSTDKSRSKQLRKSSKRPASSMQANEVIAHYFTKWSCISQAQQVQRENDEKMEGEASGSSRENNLVENFRVIFIFFTVQTVCNISIRIKSTQVQGQQLETTESRKSWSSRTYKSGNQRTTSIWLTKTTLIVRICI